MKSFLVPFAVFLTALASLHASDLASHITAVTVYPDRAVITRTATATLAAGDNELVLPDLPEALQDQSLQVSASGAGPATLLDITIRRTHLAASANPHVRALRAELHELQQKVRVLDDDLAGLKNQASLIQAWQRGLVAPGGPNAARPQPGDVQTALEYGRTHLPELAAQSRTVERQRDDLREQISALEKQLADLTAKDQREAKSVLVRLQAAQAGPLALTLRYTVTQAGWTPSYDARVNSDQQQVQLGYFGIIRQNTGEDWDNVALTLSTARPALGGAAPELHPWTLDVFTPRPSPLEPIAYKDQASPALMAAVRSSPAAFAQAAVEQAATSATFKITAPATILSNNEPRKVPITSAELKAALSYAATPKLRETAFLTAKVANTTAFPLLAGPLSAFLNGAFVATSRLELTMPGEDFSLALGADEGISVTRKLVRKFTEQTGLFSKGHRAAYDYLISLANHKDVPVHLIVHDQVPVSRNQQIVVNVLNPPSNEAKPDAEGRLQWSLDLPPGAKRDLKLEFTVDYPQGVTVTGLE